MKKLLTVLGGAGVLLVGLAAPAWAHIEPTVEEAPEVSATVRFSVGSSVTAMISAIASAASAHDRAANRRGDCSVPGVASTSSATTFPGRVEVSTTWA